MNIIVNGQQVKAVPVTVVKSEEAVSHYLLANGTMLHLRTILTAALIVPGQFDALGHQAYHTAYTVIVSTDPPEERD